MALVPFVICLVTVFHNQLYSRPLISNVGLEHLGSNRDFVGPKTVPRSESHVWYPVRLFSKLC